MADAHEVYKELSGEVNSLSNDLVAAISVFRAANSETRDDVARLEAKIDSITEKLSKLQVQLASTKTRMDESDRKDEHEARVKAEDVKGRWAFWVAVGGGAMGAVTAVVNALVALLG